VLRKIPVLFKKEMFFVLLDKVIEKIVMQLLLARYKLKVRIIKSHKLALSLIDVFFKLIIRL